jgi:hypothetical protein
VASYLVGVRQFTAFLEPHGRELIQATRADLEAFIGDLLARWSPATASTRYKQLQALYRWLEDEEEIAVNPMARMKPATDASPPTRVSPSLGRTNGLATRRGQTDTPGGRWPARGCSTPPDPRPAWPRPPPPCRCLLAAVGASKRTRGALLSSDDCGSSVEPAAKLHPLCRGRKPG